MGKKNKNSKDDDMEKLKELRNEIHTVQRDIQKVNLERSKLTSKLSELKWEVQQLKIKLKI